MRYLANELLRLLIFMLVGAGVAAFWMLVVALLLGVI